MHDVRACVALHLNDEMCCGYLEMHVCRTAQRRSLRRRQTDYSPRSCRNHPGVVDVRGGRTLADLILARGGPTLATLIRPRSEDLFAKRSSVSGKTPGLAALVGHEGRWATLAGLVPICPGGTLVDLTPKYLTLVASSPP